MGGKKNDRMHKQVSFRGNDIFVTLFKIFNNT